MNLIFMVYSPAIYVNYDQYINQQRHW